MTPATLPPIKPLNAHRKKFEAALRKAWLRPAFVDIEKCLRGSTAEIAQALRAVGQPRLPTALANPTKAAIQAHMRRVEAYHRERTRMTILRALGMDGRPILSDAVIRPVMEKAVAENVALIRELDAATRRSLTRAVLKATKEKSFGRKSLDRIVRREMRAAGRRLKIITRDQTNKAIGRLTKTRHKELGITEYIWATRDDRRVRPEHQALGGTRHRWDTPPSEGHPGEAILCRCVAIPVMDTAEKEAEKPPPNDADQYPKMQLKERIEWKESPDDNDFYTHENLKGWRAAEDYLELYRFIHNGAEAIRNEMNAYGKLVSPRTKAMDRRISELAVKGDKDMITWRGRYFEGDLKVGKTIGINSPTSTSTSIGVSSRFAQGDTMMRVHLPKDVQRVVCNPDELEVTIPKGYQFRVVRVYKGPMEAIVAGEHRMIRQWVDVVVEEA